MSLCENYSSLKPLVRSLLQKAVRRGFSEVAEKTALAISHCGDGLWLDSRISIIIFEECWPLSSLLSTEPNKLKALNNVACSKKNKNAAGLGSLAFALEKGDFSPLHLFPKEDAVKIVAAGLRRPNDFFKWIDKLVSNENQQEIILASKAYISKATWPWDKAFMIAASYLSIFEENELIAEMALSVNGDFPYWIAVDRHTPQGRNAMHKLSRHLHVDYETLSWASFFFESARVNEISVSGGSWFKKELDWKIYKLGVSEKDMKNLWDSNFDLYAEIVFADASKLKNFIEKEYPNIIGI